MATSAHPTPAERLEALLGDSSVEEVMINGPHKAFVISGGRKTRHDLGFETDAELREAIGAMVHRAGRRLDDRTPLADVRLPDGSRLNAVIAPLAPYTTVTIRRFVLRDRALDDLVKLGMLPAGPARFLDAAMRSGVNLLVAGGTSTGKTTLLNALCACIAPDERVVTIEETRELYLEHVLDDVCALECHTLPGGPVTVRDLVKNALRMRPSRIIVGEVRGPEALDVLTAMTSGHEGSMCTIHADSARDALSKLHTYALMTGEGVPRGAAMEMIARAIQLVIFCKRAREGDARQVETIFEVTGLQEGVFTGQEIFTRRDGELAWTGVRPHVESRLNECGHELRDVFRDTGSYERAWGSGNREQTVGLLGVARKTMR
jgi:pilus assembly protein CpaF